MEPGFADAAAAVGAQMGALPKPLAAYLLSTLYATMLPDEVRSGLGVFFTPPAIADRLLDLAENAGIDWTRHRIVDPAAGGGAFVTPVAVRVAAHMAAAGAEPTTVLREVERRVRGIELDPFSAWMTWVFSEVALWDYCAAAGTRLRNPVRVRDALQVPSTWYGSADLVVGNPPYGKVTPEPELRARFARSLFGHANLYGLFTDLAVRMAGPDGHICYVTPASFLGGQYFKNLRALLLADAPPVAIDFVSDRSGVFENVLQETVLVVLGRGRSPQPVAVHFNRPTASDAPCDVTSAGHFPLPADIHAPWLLPRAPGDAGLLQRSSTLPYRLGDYGFRISTGPLVWNRHRSQLVNQPVAGAYPVVWAESVLPTGEFRFTATRRNHVSFCTVAAHQAHLIVREPCVLVQRTTAKEQERRLIAATLPADFVIQYGGVVVENHVNIIRHVGRSSEICEGAAGLSVVAALLNSAPIDRLFRCINGSVAVSAYELESLPMPGPDVMRALIDLSGRGGSQQELSDLINQAYGLETRQAY